MMIWFLMIHLSWSPDKALLERTAAFNWAIVEACRTVLNPEPIFTQAPWPCPACWKFCSSTAGATPRVRVLLQPWGRTLAEANGRTMPGRTWLDGTHVGQTTSLETKVIPCPQCWAALGCQQGVYRCDSWLVTAVPGSDLRWQCSNGRVQTIASHKKCTNLRWPRRCSLHHPKFGNWKWPFWIGKPYVCHRRKKGSNSVALAKINENLANNRL